MHYGTRAKEWITDHDVKQKNLAKEFSVTESMMSNYLTGRTEMPVEMLVKFARRFHLSTDYLLGLSDSAQRPMELSRTEEHLIEAYRTLNREQKELITQTIRFMQQQNQE